MSHLLRQHLDSYKAFSFCLFFFIFNYYAIFIGYDRRDTICKNQQPRVHLCPNTPELLGLGKFTDSSSSSSSSGGGGGDVAVVTVVVEATVVVVEVVVVVAVVVVM